MHENRETSEIPVAKHNDRTAGEGSGRTARVYVCEESHRGIVPMSHSNKDGASSAESEEGRLRLKENALSSGMYALPAAGTPKPLGCGSCSTARSQRACGT